MSVITQEEGAGVDFAALRTARRQRVLAEMERRNVDALVVWREANAKYISGARRLWRAVVTAFSPGCVLVRATGAVHLMNTWDDGIPRDIPNANLYGLSWNPQNYVEALRRVEGLGDARRIGVDGMSSFFAKMLPAVAPNAELCDGEDLLRSVRAVKLPAEVACIQIAIAVAEGALVDVIEAIRPGVTERHLLGIFDQRMTSFGVTTPAVEGPFCAVERDGTLRQLPGDRALVDGDLVALSPAVLYAGYEGGVGRTWPCGTAPAGASGLYSRWQRVYDAIEAACVPGAVPSDLRRAYQATGEPLAPLPIAHGVGLGVESPMVGGSLGPDIVPSAPLQVGMVLALQAFVAQPGVGGYLGKEIVHLTDDGPARLTRLAHHL